MNRLLMRMRHIREAKLFSVIISVAIGFFIHCARGADINNGDPSVVVETSERRLEIKQDDEKAWSALTEAFIEAGDFKRAEKALADWREKVSHSSPLAEKLGAELAFERGTFQDALTAWQRYLALQPGDYDGWKQYAWACTKARDWNSGVEASTAALEIKKDADGYVQRANFRLRLHDWANAESDIRQANKLDATNVGVLRLLPVFERSAQWLTVMTKLDASIAKDPSNSQLRLNRAEWLVAEELTDLAGDDIEEAAKLNPVSLRARVWSGLLAWDRQEPDKAGNMMQMRISSVTQQFEAELKAMDASTDHEAQAEFLLKNGQPLMALEEVRDIDGSVTKARALVDLKRFPEARIATRKAVEAHPQDSVAWLTIAKLELENGNLKEAIDAADRSIKLKKTPKADDLRKTAIRRLGEK